MHGTRKWSGESMLAWVIVILLHAVLWRGLTRIDTPGLKQVEHTTRLQLVWIDREPPPIAAASTTIAAMAVRKPPIRARPRDAEAVRDAAVIPRDAAAPPQPVRSLSAVFLEQGRRHAQQLAEAERVPLDPFASRTGGFDAPAANRIRMKRQISPQDVVAAVGQYLFAPPGYEQDPCPQNQRNIRRLMTDLDPGAMQRELDYEREYCRP
ncbi:MAG: hypothetical protein LH470_06240 [Lysobacter sp.]|nr:hypothetical protein [Lysobacter sp.]